MAKYTFAQLQELWIQAGGNKLAAPVAAAIAMAESGGNPNSVNAANRNGTIDRGLWQINSIHGSQSTFDPLANARAAVGISKGGTDWRPWCVAWSNGRCGGTFMGAGAPVLKFIPAGTSNSAGVVPTAGNSNPTVTGSGPVIPGPLGDVLNAFGFANPQDMLNAWGARVKKTIYFFLLAFTGAGLMILGIVLLIASTRTVKGFVKSRLFPEQPDVVVNVQAPERPEPAPAPWEEPRDPTEPIPVSAPPEPPTPTPTPAPFVEPKKPAYKPKHYLRVKKPSQRTVIARRGRGDITREWMPDPKYKARH